MVIIVVKVQRISSYQTQLLPEYYFEKKLMTEDVKCIGLKAYSRYHNSFGLKHISVSERLETAPREDRQPLGKVNSNQTVKNACYIKVIRYLMRCSNLPW
jgi:hypothetical protein